MALILHKSGFATSGPLLATREFWGSDPIIWVDSVNGSDSNAGTARKLPKATVFGASGAISVCTSGGANLVVCEKTHRETISSAYTWSTQGVTLLSLGSGSDRATFTSAVAGVAITVSTGSVRLENLYFAASTAATTARISVTGGGFEIRDCQIDMGDNDATDGILLNYTTNGPGIVRGCTFRATAQAAGTTQVGLRLTGASTAMVCEDCTFDGGSTGFTEAAFDLDNGGADRFRILGLVLQNYAIGKIITGLEGYVSIKAMDATSRIEWAE